MNIFNQIDNNLINKWLSAIENDINLNTNPDTLVQYAYDKLITMLKSDPTNTVDINQIYSSDVHDFLKQQHQYSIIYQILNICKYIRHRSTRWTFSAEGRRWFRQNEQNIKQIFMNILSTLPKNILLDDDKYKFLEIIAKLIPVNAFDELKPDVDDESWDIMRSVLINRLQLDVYDYLQEYLSTHPIKLQSTDKILDKLMQFFIDNFDFYLSKTSFKKVNNVYKYTFDDEDNDTVHDLSNIINTFKQYFDVNSFCKDNNFNITAVKKILNNFEKYINSQVNQTIYSRIRSYLIRENIKTINKERGELLLNLSDDDKINVKDSYYIDFDPRNDNQRDRPIVVTRNDKDYVLLGDFGVSHTTVLKDPNNAKFFKNNQSNITYKTDNIEGIEIAFAYYLGHIAFIDKTLCNTFSNWDEVVSILKSDPRIMKVYSCDKVTAQGGPITRLAKKHH